MIRPRTLYANEIWKDIEDYEGYYQISNYGRLRSLDRIVIHSNGKVRKYKGTVIKLANDKNGYRFTHLYKNGKPKQVRIHRLVATYFIPNPDNLPIVNHKDENPKNNYVDNLEWCDYKYNTNYGTAPQRRMATRRSKPLSERFLKSLQIKALNHKKKIGMYKDGILIKTFESAADANREYKNLNYVSLSAACNGRLKTYRGYEWRFI